MPTLKGTGTELLTAFNMCQGATNTSSYDNRKEVTLLPDKERTCV